MRLKHLVSFASAAGLMVGLAACTPATNSNTNSVTLDLTNAATNTAGTNVNASSNVNTLANTNAATNTNTSTSAAVAVRASGFSPSTVTVKAGTVVTWTNASGGDIRIASDPHPIHTDLPGLDSSTLSNGDAYSFTFSQKGTWGYHNHLDPSMKGTVVVE